LPNNNKNATVSNPKNFHELNKALMAAHQQEKEVRLTRYRGKPIQIPLIRGTNKATFTH